MKDLKTLDFLMSAELKKLKSLLVDSSEEEFRFVGGCVRDALLTIKPNDIDICTTAIPEKVIALCHAAKVTVIPIGLKHGTVTTFIDGVQFEITTLRIDTDTDGRHANVKWTTSFEEDASRRDFTYNAMSIDFDGNLYDYFNGVKDLRHRKTVFVGDLKDRIGEDYLRVLRFFRFSARFDSVIDHELLNNIGSDSIKQGLANISKERVWSEMSKLFMSTARFRVAQAFEQSGLASVIGLQQAPSPLLNRADDAVSALASYSLTQKEAESIANSWKLSTFDKKKLIWLVSNKERSELNFIQDSLVNEINRSWVISHTKLHNLNVEEAVSFQPPVFPLSGQDLLDYGLKQSRELGTTLFILRKKWMESRFALSKDDLLESMK
jgi:tRNA nucleotidyltransferase/poly(A) polymerase